MDGGYDSGYRACKCFWGTEPSSLVMRLSLIVDSFLGLDVLDAGCGEGKNALFLAARGGFVRACDVSEFAIANARELATTRAVEGVRFEVKDVRELQLQANRFDVVIAYGLLHCLRGRSEVSSLCRRLQSATRVGGYLILCAFNDRRQDLTAHPGFSPTLLAHDTYKDLFVDWTLIECSDSDLTETHPNNGIEHTHSMTRLLAKKHVQEQS